MLRLKSLLLATCVATTAHALTVRPPSFSELVGSADAVVVGHVTQIESVLRTVNGRPVPFTLVTVQVDETLKGPDEPNIVLQCLGGTIGSESLKVVGVPEFAIGDHGFFFVQNNGTQFFPLVGVSHGIYRTITDEQSGNVVVARENGEPLVSIAQISQPLEHRSRIDMTRAAALSQTSLTAAQFSQSIKAEVAHAR